ncbi:MAG: hypothetical protein WCE90_03925 [Candidatus Zixiibacteriota bacterium]
MNKRKRNTEKGRRKRGKAKTRNRGLWSSIFLFSFFVFLLGFRAWADYYSPSDSVPLTIGTVSIKSDSVQDCDSIRIKWWRLNGGWNYVGTKKLTSSVETGFYSTNVKASDASNHTGSYVAEAVAYRFGGSYTDIKTWSWTVAEALDSLTNAVADVNKANFKTDVSNLLGKGDSSLYMRADWSNIKNQNATVNLSSTRLHRVDSLGEEMVASVDTSQIKVMNNNNQWGAPSVWSFSNRTLTSGAGSGVRSVVIRCKSSSDNSPIAFVQIQVLDSMESSTIGLLNSDSQGRGFFALDDAAYRVRLYKPGYQFTVPEILRVNGNEDTTYHADAFDPGLPPEASLCRVYGWIHDIKNQPVVGAKIEAGTRTIPLKYQNVIISPYYQSTLTDDNGYWYLDLYPNSILSPSNTKYLFHLFDPSGTILRLETTVPTQGSWELQW